MATLSIQFSDGEGEGEVHLQVKIEGHDGGEKGTPAMEAGIQCWNMVKGLLSAQASQEKRLDTPPEPELILPPGIK